MFKKVMSAFWGYMISISILPAQHNNLDRLLASVEQNNAELIAFHANMNSQLLGFQTDNKLPDPQAGAYYLPWGNHLSGDYVELQLTQTFEFPTVYGVRKTLIGQQNEHLETEYRLLRQDILLQVIQLWHEGVYLNQVKQTETERIALSRQVFTQIETLFNAEEKGILEYNKAKIIWMQQQFALEEIEHELARIQNHLSLLNGGLSISIEQQSFDDKLVIASLDSLWQQKLEQDPSLNILQVQEGLAAQNIQLSHHLNRPQLTLGINYQGVSGEYYGGVFGGFSIPLWSNRNRIAAAEAQYLYQQSHTTAKRSQRYTRLQTQYQRYQHLIKNYREYEQILNGLDSESLLLTAYQLEEISFQDFYLELQFYYQAADKLREMELSILQLKAELLKFQL
ncbi:MAG: TolC family protein [Bacteroidia bacterium]